MEKTYTEKEVKALMSKAYNKGIAWCLVYHTWFTPSKSDHAKQKKSVIDAILNSRNRKPA